MLTYDIAHASTELLESAEQNRYLIRYLKGSEARAISGHWHIRAPGRL